MAYMNVNSMPSEFTQHVKKMIEMLLYSPVPYIAGRNTESVVEFADKSLYKKEQVKAINGVADALKHVHDTGVTMALFYQYDPNGKKRMNNSNPLLPTSTAPDLYKLALSSGVYVLITKDPENEDLLCAEIRIKPSIMDYFTSLCEEEIKFLDTQLDNFVQRANTRYEYGMNSNIGEEIEMIGQEDAPGDKGLFVLVFLKQNASFQILEVTPNIPTKEQAEQYALLAKQGKPVAQPQIQNLPYAQWVARQTGNLRELNPNGTFTKENLDNPKLVWALWEHAENFSNVTLVGRVNILTWNGVKYTINGNLKIRVATPLIEVISPSEKFISDFRQRQAKAMMQQQQQGGGESQTDSMESYQSKIKNEMDSSNTAEILPCDDYSKDGWECFQIRITMKDPSGKENSIEFFDRVTFPKDTDPQLKQMILERMRERSRKAKRYFQDGEPESVIYLDKPPAGYIYQVGIPQESNAAWYYAQKLKYASPDQVQKISIVTGTPADLVFAIVFAIYDIGEAAYKIGKSVYPHIKEGAKRGSGGWGDTFRRVFRKIRFGGKKLFLAKTKGLSADEASKILVDDIFKDVKRQGFDKDPQKALLALNELTAEQLKFLPKDLILELDLLRLLNPAAMTFLRSTGYFTAKDSFDYNARRQKNASKLIFGLPKNLTDLQKKSFREQVESGEVDTDLEEEVSAEDIDKLTNSRTEDAGTEEQANSLIMQDINTMLTPEELKALYDVQNIGEPITIITIATAVVAVTAIAGAVSVAGVVGAKVAPDVMAGWAKGSGGWGDALRRTKRQLYRGVKAKWLKWIRRKSDAEIKKILADDILKKAGKMDPQEAINIIQTMATQDLISLPKEARDGLIANFALTSTQVALLRNQKPPLVTEAQLKYTVYNPDFVLQLKKLSKNQLIDIPPTTLLTFMRQCVFTIPQVLFLILANRKDAETGINEKQLRGFCYGKGERRKQINSALGRADLEDYVETELPKEDANIEGAAFLKKNNGKEVAASNISQPLTPDTGVSSFYPKGGSLLWPPISGNDNILGIPPWYQQPQNQSDTVDNIHNLVSLHPDVLQYLLDFGSLPEPYSMWRGASQLFLEINSSGVAMLRAYILVMSPYGMASAVLNPNSNRLEYQCSTTPFQPPPRYGYDLYRRRDGVRLGLMRSTTNLNSPLAALLIVARSTLRVLCNQGPFYPFYIDVQEEEPDYYRQSGLRSFLSKRGFKSASTLAATAAAAAAGDTSKQSGTVWENLNLGPLEDKKVGIDMQKVFKNREGERGRLTRYMCDDETCNNVREKLSKRFGKSIYSKNILNHFVNWILDDVPDSNIIQKRIDFIGEFIKLRRTTTDPEKLDPSVLQLDAQNEILISEVLRHHSIFIALSRTYPSTLTITYIDRQTEQVRRINVLISFENEKQYKLISEGEKSSETNDNISFKFEKQWDSLIEMIGWFINNKIKPPENKENEGNDAMIMTDIDSWKNIDEACLQTVYKVDGEKTPDKEDYIRQTIIPQLLSESSQISMNFKETVTYVFTGIPGLLISKLRKKKNGKNGKNEALDEDIKKEKNEKNEKNGKNENASIGKAIRYRSSPHISSAKARTILRHNEVRGHRLTPRQQRFFGWIAGSNRSIIGDEIDSKEEIEISFKKDQIVKTAITNDPEEETVFFFWTSEDKSVTLYTVEAVMNYISEMKNKEKRQKEINFWKLAIYAGGALTRKEVERSYTDPQAIVNLSLEEIQKWLDIDIDEEDAEGNMIKISRKQNPPVIIPFISNQIEWKVDSDQTLNITDNKEDDLDVMFEGNIVLSCPVNIEIPKGKISTTLEFKQLALDKENGLQSIVAWIGQEEDNEYQEEEEQEEEEQVSTSPKSDITRVTFSPSMLLRIKTTAGRLDILNELVEKIYQAKRENDILRSNLSLGNNSFKVPKTPSRMGIIRFRSYFNTYKKLLNKILNDNTHLRGQQ